LEVSAESVRCYHRSALRRPPSQSWRTFLHNHAPHIWAADFFTVPTVTFHTLYVFFITHDRRRIVHLNVTAHPTAEWVWRQLIAATPWGEQPRYLMHDRDRCYGGAFIRRAARIGIRTLLTPVRAPKANAIAERLVGRLRRECLDHLIVINERHLRALLAEYAAHYKAARPNRALALYSPDGRPIVRLASGRIVPGPCLVASITSTSGSLHEPPAARIEVLGPHTPARRVFSSPSRASLSAHLLSGMSVRAPLERPEAPEPIRPRSSTTTPRSGKRALRWQAAERPVMPAPIIAISVWSWPAGRGHSSSANPGSSSHSGWSVIVPPRQPRKHGRRPVEGGPIIGRNDG
jgi:hypothetical protein